MEGRFPATEGSTAMQQKHGQAGFALAESQRAMKGQPGWDACHHQLAMVLEGAVEEGRIRAVLAALLARHPVLQSRGAAGGIGGEDLRVADRELDFQAIESPGSGLEEILEMVEAAWSKPHDADRDAAVRFCWVRVGEERSFLLVRVQAVWADSYSCRLVFQQIQQQLTSMQAASEGSMSFADFANWQEELSQAADEDAGRYWRGILEGRSRDFLPFGNQVAHPPQLQRIRIATFEGEDHAALLAQAREMACALPELFMARWAAYLAGFTDREFCIGYLPFFRNYRELEGTVGLVSQVLPMHWGEEGEDSIQSMVAKVRQSWKEGNEWADQFRPMLHIPARSSDALDFPCQFEWIPAPGSEAAVSLADAWHHSWPCWLRLTGTDHGDRLTLDLYHDAGRWNRDELAVVEAQLRHQFQAGRSVLEQAAGLSPFEADWMGQVNATRAGLDLDLSVVAMFTAQVAAHPHATALIHGEKRISYAQLDVCSSQLAEQLGADFGIGAGDVVGLLLDRSPELVAALWGILKCGAAYLPMDTQAPASRVEFMLRDSGASLLVSDGSLSALHPGGIPVLDMATWAAPADGSSPAKAINIAPDSPAYLMYTSGSTGNPKGCLVSHRNLSNYVQWANGYYFQNASQGNWAFLTSIAFDLTVTSIFTSLTRGRSLYIARNGMEILDTLRECLSHPEVDSLKLTPAHLSLLKGLGLSAPHLRALVCGGSQLTRDQVATVWQMQPGARIFNEYGPTEATVGTIVQEVKPDATEILIGKPIANTQIRIVDENGQPVPIGRVGEIWIAGESVAMGYLGNPSLTAERFFDDPLVPGWRVYRTGDMARWLPSGEIAYIGRRDDQVKVRGFRVELGEVEAALLGCPGVQAAAVTLHTLPDGEEALVAHTTGDATPETLRTLLQALLPPQLVPSFWVKLETLPLTTNGKVDRKALPSPDFTSMEAGEPQAATPTEATVRRIWADVLNLPEDRIGLEADFFLLGGHSLTGTRLLARIHQALDMRLKLRDLFDAPTVRGLSLLLDQRLLAASQHGDLPDAYRVIPAIAQARHYPLSRAQQRIWLQHQQAADPATFNMPGAFQFEGDVSIEALQQAFQFVIDRHASLRTTFPLVDGEPVQSVAAHVDFSPQMVDAPVSGNPDAYVQRRIAQHTAHAFDLEKGPLLQVEFFRLQDRLVCLYNIHHIVSDGWSETVLVRDLLHAYRAFTAGAMPNLTPLRIQYPDYSAWHGELLRSPAMAVHEAYWRERFAEPVQKLELPEDHPLPRAADNAGAEWVGWLDPDLSHRLRQLGHEARTSLFGVLLAGFKATLHRLAGSEDIVVATPDAGRDHVELEDQIGFFVNMLPLRTRLGAGQTFRELLAAVKETLDGALAHKDYPFDLFMEGLAATQPGATELLRVDVGMLQDNLRALREAADLLVSVLPQGSLSAKWDLTVNFIEVDEAIRMEMDYRKALFSEQRIQQVFTAFTALLEGVVADPGMPLGSYELVPVAEQERLAAIERGPALPERLGQSWGQLWWNAVTQWASRDAIRHAGGRVSYLELDDLASKVACMLVSQRDFSPGTVVAVVAHPSVELVAGLLGTHLAGGIYMPIDPGYPEARIRYMLQDAQVRYALSTVGAAAEVPGVHWLDLWQAPAEASLSALVYARPLPSETAYLIYTSGSTGEPKGVEVSQASFANMTLSQIAAFGVRPEDRVLLGASPSFDASLSEVFMALLAGAALVPLPVEVKGMASAYLDFMDSEGITVATIPPAMLASLDRDPLPGLRVIISAGEAIDPELARYYAEGRSLFNAYGPTEFSVCATICAVPSNASALASVPIGRPLPNVEVLVLDGHLRRLPAGLEGEICLAGAGLAQGYLGRPGLTEAAFVPHPYRDGERLYRTGDRGCWNGRGELLYLGRKDRQVKIRGNRVEAAEVELHLQRHPAALAAVVDAREMPEGLALVAWVLPRSQDMPSTAFRDDLARQLPGYMVPTHWVVLDKLPMTTSGKVDRGALPVPGQVVPGNAPAEALTPLESGLKAIWEGLLSHRPIRRQDNFFAIGGHSLIATRMVTAIHAAYEVQLRLNEVLMNPTIQELAVLVGSRTKVQSSGIPRLPDQPRFPASQAQQRIFAAHTLSPDPAAYNIPIAFHLNGQVNPDAFRKALANLLQRHESLRTVVEIGPEGAWQRILAAEPPFEFLDWTGRAGQEDELRAFVTQEAGKPFLMESDLPIRFRLLRLGQADHLVILVLHHIIADGWSMEVLMRELLHYYRVANDGVGYPLEPLRVQYRDCSAWLDESVMGEYGEKAKAHWTNRLAGWPPHAQIPTDLPRNPTSAGGQAILSHAFPAKLLYFLEDLSQMEDASMFMVLVATLSIVLQAHAQTDRNVLGSPVSGREHPDMAGQVGMFMNMVPILAQEAAGDRFTDFMGRVKGDALAAFAHQEWHFEALVATVAPNREPGRNPIFDFEIDFDLFRPEDEWIEEKLPHGWKLTPFWEDGDLLTRKYDVEFRLRRVGDSLQLTLVYDPGLYRESTLRLWLRGWEEVMDRVGMDPAQSVAELKHELRSLWRAEQAVTQAATKRSHLDKFLKTSTRADGGNAPI